MRTTTHILRLLAAAAVMSWSASCRCDSGMPALDNAERIIMSQPDSALHILQSIPKTAITSDAERARYALLYSKALDKNYIDVACDSLIIDAVEYYDRYGDNISLAESYYYLGRIYENAGSAQLAIDAFVKAEHYAEDSEACYLKGLIYEHIGVYYNAQRDFGQAITKLRLAADNYRKAEADNCLPSAYVNLMKSFMMNNDVGNAFEYLGKTRNLAEQRRDTSLLLCTALYHANFLNRRLDAPESALEVLRSAYDRYGVSQPPVDHCAALSTIYLQMGNIDTARLYARRCMSQRLSPGMRLGGLRLMTQIELAARDIDAYADYVSRHDALRDSIYAVEKGAYIQNIDRSHYIQCLKERNETLLGKIAVQNRICIAISLLLVLIIIAAVVAIRRKHLRLQSARRLAADIEMQCKRLIHTYNALNADNNSLCAMVDERTAMLRDIMQLAGNNRTDAEAFLAEFKRYIKSGDKHSATAIFRSVIESRRPGILQYIATRYPELNGDDIDLYSLICGGCSVDILCLVYDNTVKYMYNKRAALRKKLQLRDGDCSIQLHFEQMTADFNSVHITSEKSA